MKESFIKPQGYKNISSSESVVIKKILVIRN
jgi:hypothetical protein